MKLLRAPDDRLRLGWRILAFAVLFVGLAVPVGALVTPLIPGPMAGASLPALLGALGAGWILLAMEGRSPAALGFHGGRELVGEVVLGLALGCVVGLAAVALMAVAGGVGWERDVGSAAAWLAVLVASLWTFLLPAAAEEALFRGYPLQALAEGWGPGWAIVVTSIVFGLAHLPNPAVTVVGALNVAAAGAFLGVLYLRTGSLWWATGAHLGWNWAHGFLVDLPVSGLDLVDAPLLEGRTEGPAWLSGGAFGPEGSLLATAVLLGATVWAWRSGALAPSRGLRGHWPLALLGRRGQRVERVGSMDDRGGNASG